MTSHPLRGSTVMITGGTGSFGHRFASSIRRFEPREIRILSRDEKKQWEMQNDYPDFRYFIGDVRDRRSIEDAIRGVDYVFHAAALKQVPACEMYPMEALKSNTIGAANVCDAAWEADVKAVVALSTDKAVKPINAMGLTKAMMEKIVTSQNQFRKGTVFCCVRYGNVMGTRGSVIPLFRRLVADDRPIPVTVPEMTRFLMTLDQSVDLVLHAMTTARGGEIFVRKAPACTVIDLARAVAGKYGRRGPEHPVKVTGPRHGEKMHEVLVNEYEMQRAIESDEYFLICPEYRQDANSAVPFGTEYTSENTRRANGDEISALLDAMGAPEAYI